MHPSAAGRLPHLWGSPIIPPKLGNTHACASLGGLVLVLSAQPHNAREPDPAVRSGLPVNPSPAARSETNARSRGRTDAIRSPSATGRPPRATRMQTGPRA